MFQIGNSLVSEEIITNSFVCNLKACKGACCVEGEAGAPLEKTETEFPQVLVGRKLFKENSKWVIM